LWNFLGRASGYKACCWCSSILPPADSLTEIIFKALAKSAIFTPFLFACHFGGAFLVAFLTFGQYNPNN
jgi:hypothetical protein